MEEEDSDIDGDIFPELDMEESVSATQERNKELDAVVWWIVAFTSFFQSMHTLSTRATQWLLLFLSVLLEIFQRRLPI